MSEAYQPKPHGIPVERFIEAYQLGMEQMRRGVEAERMRNLASAWDRLEWDRAIARWNRKHR